MFGHDDHQDENDKPHEEHHNDDSWQHPGPPPSDDDLSSASDAPVISGDHRDDSDNSGQDNNPALGFSISQNTPDHDSGHDEAGIEPTHSQNDDQNDDGDTDGADNDLIDLKQEALTKLSPLIGHLDQTPDEKFRTLMMMIQASDDQRLVHQAYETALNISDEKEKAQALLDIVNEINYFTHNPKQ